MMNKKNQGGFSLFLVMVLMVVIALLVIVTNQSSLTEMRISGNDADRKLAFSRAEKGLEEAEASIKDAVESAIKDPKKKVVFMSSCLGYNKDEKGYCYPATGILSENLKDSPFVLGSDSMSRVEAWQRCASDGLTDCSGKKGKTILDSDKRSIRTKDGKGRYVIEYLGHKTQNGTTKEMFRVTSKAVGDNEDTNVMLQSYVELTRGE